MLNIQRILVATDFSASARFAQERAERFAHFLGADLHLLHVVGPDEAAPTEHEGGAPDAVDEAAEPGQKAAANSSVLPVLRRAPDVVRGILEYAREHDIDLIAMGTNGHSGLKRWMLGSVAEEVVRRAPCPVVTIREGLGISASDQPRRLLVPVDFAESTRSLIAHARGLAALAAGQIDLLYVLEEPAALRLFEVDGFRAMLPRLASRSRVRLLEEAEAVPGPRVPLRAHVLTGDPGREIARYAEAQRMDLVLMGTHGNVGPRTAAIGSVTERVMRTAPCPVFALNVTEGALVRPDRPRPTLRSWVV